MKVLITGGAGYIGSTVASACADDSIDVVVLDNFSTGRREFVRGRTCYEGDVADPVLLRRIFADHPDIDVTVHCAALTVVPESVAEPLRYYRENVAKSVDLVATLHHLGRARLIFSSSAAIYAPAGSDRVDEDSPASPANPYARTKEMVETVLGDAATSGALEAVSLRYFNPIGADPELRTGPQRPRPSHVLGRLCDAYRTGGTFRLTGTGWPTRDGTAVRDYVHVWDVAAAHVAALRNFDRVMRTADGARHVPINVGTGQGTTVRELLSAFERVVGTRLGVEESPARPGDTAGCFTTIDRAIRLLDWKPALGIDDAIRHQLAWDQHRPAMLGI